MPDPVGVIHGCFKRTDGSLRVIDTATGQTCLNGYTPLSWSQTGPQGPSGAPGPSGPPGLSGVHVVDQTFSISGPLTIRCPTNETVLSVSFDEPDGQTHNQFYYANPNGRDADGRPTGYLLNGQPSPGAALAPWSVHLTCAITY